MWIELVFGEGCEMRSKLGPDHVGPVACGLVLADGEMVGWF